MRFIGVHTVAWMGKRLTRPTPPLAEELLTVDGYLGKSLSSFQGVDPGGGDNAPVDNPTPMRIKAATTIQVPCKPKRKHEVGMAVVGRGGWEGSRGDR